MKYLKKIFESEALTRIDYLESMFIDIIESDLYKASYYSEDYPNADKGPLTEWFLIISFKNEPQGFNNTKDMSEYFDMIKDQAMRINDIIEHIKEEYSDMEAYFYYKNIKCAEYIAFEVSFNWINNDLK